MRRGLQAAKAFTAALSAVLILSNLATGFASGQTRCVRTVPGPVVCLTVDDGFSADSIRSMLKTLKKNGVKCTFFVVGAFLTRPGFPPLWRQAVKDGHEICYHTMRHQHIVNMTKSQIVADIAAWEDAARKTLGSSYRIPKFARFPGGAGSYDPGIVKIYADCGYRVVRWSVDTLTGPESHATSIKSYVRGYTRPGSIILTHFNGADARALPGYIGWLKSKYKLVRISDAFPASAQPQPTAAINPRVTPERWFRSGCGGSQYRYPTS